MLVIIIYENPKSPPELFVLSRAIPVCLQYADHRCGLAGTCKIEPHFRIAGFDQWSIRDHPHGPVSHRRSRFAGHRQPRNNEYQTGQSHPQAGQSVQQILPSVQSCFCGWMKSMLRIAEEALTFDDVCSCPRTHRSSHSQSAVQPAGSAEYSADFRSNGYGNGSASGDCHGAGMVWCHSLIRLLSSREKKCAR